MPCVTWRVVTARAAREARIDSLLQMLDEMPINVMMADPKTFVILTPTTSPSSSSTSGIPADRPENLVGTSIDVFHKHPEHQRALLSDPNNLPHSARIRVGDQTVLKASAVMDKNGAYVGMMVSWSVITKQIAITDQFENEVKGVVDTVSVAGRCGGNRYRRRPGLAKGPGHFRPYSLIDERAFDPKRLLVRRVALVESPSESYRITLWPRRPASSRGPVVGRSTMSPDANLCSSPRRAPSRQRSKSRLRRASRGRRRRRARPVPSIR